MAAGCDNKPHEYTIRLIRKYQTEFEQLGHLRFENGEKTGKQGQQTVYAVLNEDVALLAEVRRMNQSFLQADMSYDERKKKLVAFATKRRTKALTTF